MLSAALPVEPVVVPAVIISRFSGKRLAENNLSVCGYFSAVFSSQHLSLSGQYFGAGLCGHIV